MSDLGREPPFAAGVMDDDTRSTRPFVGLSFGILLEASLSGRSASEIATSAGINGFGRLRSRVNLLPRG